jgi:hypothetical protein
MSRERDTIVPARGLDQRSHERHRDRSPPFRRRSLSCDRGPRRPWLPSSPGRCRCRISGLLHAPSMPEIRPSAFTLPVRGLRGVGIRSRGSRGASYQGAQARGHGLDGNQPRARKVHPQLIQVAADHLEQVAQEATPFFPSADIPLVFATQARGAGTISTRHS